MGPTQQGQVRSPSAAIDDRCPSFSHRLCVLRFLTRAETVTRPVRDATGIRMVRTRVQRPTLARGDDFNMTVWPVSRHDRSKRSDLARAKPYAAKARLGRFSPSPRLQHAVWAAVGNAEFEYRPAPATTPAKPEQQDGGGEGGGGGGGGACPARMHLVLALRCERPLLQHCGAKATAAVLRCDEWPCVRPVRSTATFLVLVPARQQHQRGPPPPVTLPPMFEELPEGGDAAGLALRNAPSLRRLRRAGWPRLL